MRIVLLLVLTVVAGVAMADRNTDLYAAAKAGDAGAVKSLLKTGVNINMRHEYERTPLMAAARQGKVEVTQALIDAGTDVNAKDVDGKTALMHAVAEDNLPAVQLLLAHGADVEGARQMVALASSAEQTTDVAEIVRVETLHTRSTTLPRKFPPGGFERMARRVLEDRRWEVETVNARYAIGRITKGGRTYKAKIEIEDSMEPAVINVGYVRGYGSRQPNWIQSLKRTLDAALPTAYIEME